MKKALTSLLAACLTVASLSVAVSADRAGNAVYYMPAEDHGIMLEPSKPGEPYYAYDGGGIREGVITQVGDTYYLFYDGAAAHEGACRQNDPEKHLWRSCLAKSTDLKNWEKLGPRLWCGYDVDPSSSPEVYKDFYSASSPWPYFNEEDNHWYLFYLGAEGAAPSGGDVGTPSTYYSTLVAKAKTEGPSGIEGEYLQYNHVEGQEKCVVLWDKPATVSPGSVMVNPRWTGPEDTVNMRYMMFVTRGDTICIARSNSLDAVHDWDQPAGAEGWTVTETILDPTRKTAPENATIFYDENTGWYYLFTNQFSTSYTYTDCNIVYWTRDPNMWDPAHCAVVTDSKSSKDGWATGAIGMPSAVRVDDGTVAIVYDAQEGTSLTHLGRKLGIAYWKLPRLAEDGTPLDFEPQNGAAEELVKEGEILFNDSDPAIRYIGDFIHDGGGGSSENFEGDCHYSNTRGVIEFTFTGTGIKWIGNRVFNRGDAEVFIDGVSQGVYSQYDEGIVAKQIIFQIAGLEYGEHTIRIENRSQYTCLDAFVVNTLAEPETEPETAPESEPVTETELSTDVPTEPADTSAPESAPVGSDSEVPDSETQTDTAAMGCASAMGAAGVTASAAAAAVALKKKKED